MTTLYDLIYHALENGINLERLLKATGLDERSFRERYRNNEWNHDERKLIKEEIRQWQNQS